MFAQGHSFDEKNKLRIVSQFLHCGKFVFLLVMMTLISFGGFSVARGAESTSYFQAVLSVSVTPEDIAPQAQTSVSQRIVHNVFSFFDPLRAAQASASFTETEPRWFKALQALAQPEVTALFVFLFLASLGYAVYATRGTKHFFALFYKPHTHIFHHLAQRTFSGTYLHSYARFRRHAFLSKHLAIISGTLLFVKVTAVAFAASILLNFPFLSRATEYDVSVFPEATLTYRLDYNNLRESALSRVTFSSAFPRGMTFVPGSVLVNNISLTDATDSDGLTKNDGGFTLRIDDLPPGAGSIFWNMRVVHPAQTDAVTSTVDYQIDDGLFQQTNSVINRIATLTISGKAFYDVNRNNVVDVTTEAGARDIRLALYDDTNESGIFDGTDARIEEAKTEAQGLYHFVGLRPGIFFVKVLDDRVTNYELARSAIQVVRMQGLESISSLDIPYVLLESTSQSPALFGSLWHDQNRNQQQDEQETPLSDIEVRFYNDNNQNNILDTFHDQLVDTAFSGVDGTFQFSIPKSGDYFILISEERLPTDYTLTTMRQPLYVSIPEMKSEINISAIGYALPTSAIGDEVFEDSNNNTLHDASEAGFSDVRVAMYRDDGSEQFEKDVDLRVAETFTDAAGKYLFSHVTSGGYFLFVNTAGFPDASYHLTTNVNPRFVEIATDTDQQYLLADFGFRLIPLVDESNPLTVKDSGASVAAPSSGALVTAQSAQIPSSLPLQDTANTLESAELQATEEETLPDADAVSQPQSADAVPSQETGNVVASDSTVSSDLASDTASQAEESLNILVNDNSQFTTQTLKVTSQEVRTENFRRELLRYAARMTPYSVSFRSSASSLNTAVTQDFSVLAWKMFIVIFVAVGLSYCLVLLHVYDRHKPRPTARASSVRYQKKSRRKSHVPNTE